MSFPGGSSVKKKKKNLPTVQETQETRVRSLVWEFPLEEKMATHSCWENLVDREAWWATVHGGHRESDVTQHTPHLIANKFRENMEWEMWIYFTVHPSSSALPQAATDLWLGDYLLHSYENKCLKKDHNQSSVLNNYFQSKQCYKTILNRVEVWKQKQIGQ